MKATGATYAQNPSSSFPPAAVATAFPDGSVSLLSTVTPNVNPNSVVFINCNLVQNKYANPQTFLYPIPANGDIGALISVEPPEYAYNKMIVGQVSNLILDLTTSEGRPINIQDPNMVFILVIRDQTTHHSMQRQEPDEAPTDMRHSCNGCAGRRPSAKHHEFIEFHVR